MTQGDLAGRDGRGIERSRQIAVRNDVERHYDSLALLYRAFWGDHIHHGFWRKPDEPLAGAPERLVEHLAGRVGIRANDRVLDVGCGYGASGRWLASRLGCHVTGVTISEKQARHARRRSRRDGLSEATTVLRGDVAELPFERDAFDVVWVVECIEHLTDKAAFIDGAARLLKPGGRLALCTWARGSSVSTSGAVLVEEVCDRFLCPSLATLAEYESWCRAAGLIVTRVEEITTGVKATWDILMMRVERPWLAWLRPLLSSQTRRFVEGFPVIASAYETGAMAYGLMVAKNRYGSPGSRA